MEICWTFQFSFWWICIVQVHFVNLNRIFISIQRFKYVSAVICIQSSSLYVKNSEYFV